MSHFTSVETKIKNVNLLKRVLKELGYEFTEAEEGQKVQVKGYQGQKTEADMVIHASKTYDIGVRVTEKGVQFISDWWGVETTRGVSEEEFINSITQRYAYHTVKDAVSAKGYTVQEEEVDEHETIKIKVKGYS
ncbi:MAG: hypothetical protein CMH54_00650 [Myxococcales bacterium]|nr:hypothetical protein [Myxococcales bacterium]|tara:strand:- start:722 stop:1123 length:402 start_codon:yes stop_codon:yes gene_type:complete